MSWRLEQDVFLIDNYQNRGLEYCATALELDRRVVKKRIKQLGLHRTRLPNFHIIRVDYVKVATAEFLATNAFVTPFDAVKGGQRTFDEWRALLDYHKYRT